MEVIQNELFRQVKLYMEAENLNQTELAEKLGVTKGYISQILSGNSNFSLKKLTEMSLSLGIIPQINYKKIEEFLKEKNVFIDAKPLLIKANNRSIKIMKNEDKVTKLTFNKDEIFNYHNAVGY